MKYGTCTYVNNSQTSVSNKTYICDDIKQYN